jgi:hypothetical protein
LIIPSPTQVTIVSRGILLDHSETYTCSVVQETSILARNDYFSRDRHDIKCGAQSGSEQESHVAPDPRNEQESHVAPEPLKAQDIK